MNKKIYIILAIALVIIGGIIMSKSSNQKINQTNSAKQNTSSDPTMAKH
jgi:preprotein translocase subunit SecG